MPGVGQVVKIFDYNDIKHIVDYIYGRGSIDSGYGQTITSPTLISGDSISHEDWNKLRSDMIKIRQHQTGIPVGDSDVSDNQNLKPISAGDTVTDAIRAQYSNFAGQLTIDRFNVVDSQLTLNQSMVEDTRTTPWNNTITHSITVTGDTSGEGAISNIRYFFNAGGKLKLRASRIGGTNNTLNTGWTQLFATIGDVILDHESWFSLTTSPQVLYSHAVQDIGSYVVYGSTDVSRMQFYISVQITNALHGLGDINVDGTLTSVLVQDIPSGTNVSVKKTTAKSSGLSTTGNANSQYTMTVVPTTVDEGSSVEATINTTFVPKNSILYWTTLGTTTAGDFADGVTHGTMTVAVSDGINGVASFTRKMVQDFHANSPTKQFDITVTDSVGNIVVPVVTVHVNDTSTETYSVSTAKSVVNADSKVDFAISTVGVSNTTTLYWKIVGSVAESDFDDNKLSGPFNVTTSGLNGTATISRQLVNNGHTDRTMTLEVHSGSVSGKLEASSPLVTIQNATYSIEADSYSISNGNSVTFTIKTTGVTDGTVLTWQQTANSTTDATDFSDSLTSGSVTINGNKAILVRTTVLKYNETSLSKYLSISLVYNGITVKTSSQVDIKYSGNVSYAVTASANSVNEDADISFAIQTSGISTSEPLYWTVTGDASIKQSTFTQGLSGGPIYVNGSGNTSVMLHVVGDNKNTGTRLFVFNLLRSGIIKKSSESITINDTSKFLYNPSYSINPTSVQSPSNAVQITHTVSGGPPNTVVKLSGDAKGAYALPSTGGNMTLDNNGNGSMALTAASSIPVLTTSTSTVITATFDTGYPYTGGNLRTNTFVATGVSVTYQMAADKTSINEDEIPVVYSISTTYVDAGTKIYWKIESMSVIASEFTDGLMSGYVTIKPDGSASLSKAIRPDYKTNPGRSFTVHLYSNPEFTNELPVQAITTNINDTSMTPATGTIAVSPSTVNEGDTFSITLNTNNLKLGSTLYYKEVVVQGTDTGDFSNISGPVISGNAFTVTAPEMVWTDMVVADKKSEGEEKFRFDVYMDQALTKLLAQSNVLTVNDTSISPLANYTMVQSGIYYYKDSRIGTDTGAKGSTGSGWSSYPIYTLDELRWVAKFAFNKIMVTIYGSMEAGFRLYMKVDGAWIETNANGTIKEFVGTGHGTAGKGFAQNSITYTLPKVVNPGSIVEIGYAGGPNYQPYNITDAVASITYINTSSTLTGWYNVCDSAWHDKLRTYGVWKGGQTDKITNTVSYSFIAPEDNFYNIGYSSDNSLTFDIDGSNSTTNNTGTAIYTQTSIYLSGGIHTINISITNANGPAGVAIIIKHHITGVEIFNTRNLVSTM